MGESSVLQEPDHLSEESIAALLADSWAKHDTSSYVMKVYSKAKEIVKRYVRYAQGSLWGMSVVTISTLLVLLMIKGGLAVWMELFRAIFVSDDDESSAAQSSKAKKA